MELSQLPSIQLAGQGPVNRWNYAHLGYQRLLTGVYAQILSSDGRDHWALRRTNFLTRTRAVMLLLREKPAILYGPTALQVLGVALPHRWQDWENCHVLMPTQSAHPRREGVVVHRTVAMPEPRQWIMDMPLLHPVDHWLQFKGASIFDMVEIGEGFLRRKNPLLSIHDMRHRLDMLCGNRGWAKANTAMSLVRANTDSPYETRTRLILVASGLPEPTINCEVFCPSSQRTYHVDLGYEKEKVAVEFDGLVHVGDQRQMEIDAERRRHLQDAGWVIITVTAKQLYDPQSLVRSVKAALAR